MSNDRQAVSNDLNNYAVKVVSTTTNYISEEVVQGNDFHVEHGILIFSTDDGDYTAAFAAGRWLSVVRVS